MGKIILGIIVLLILAIALWYMLPDKRVIDEKDAREFVMEDLKHNFPDADYEILSIKENNESLKGKNFNIKARVTKYPQSACPERRHIFYNYPTQGYVTQPADVITPDCQICGGASSCTILYEEEAAIASHTRGNTTKVHDYINDKNASYDAKYDEENRLWRITWDSENADYKYIVKVGTQANIISVEPVFKD